MLALRRAILPAVRDKRSYGISDLAPIGGYRTAVLGGEPGVATGFGSVILISPRKYAPLGFRIAGRSNNTNAGWLHMGYPGTYGAIYGSMFNASGGYIYENIFNFAPSDIGKLFLHVQYYDSAGFLRTYIARSGGYYGPEIVTAPGAAQPLASYGPYNDASLGMTYFGGVQYADGQNIRDYFSLLSLMTFRSATVPTVAQLADLADRTRQLGDIPQQWSGMTVSHRWSVRDNYVRNRALISRSTGMVKNFISDSNCYQVPIGLRGSASGWWLAFAFVPLSATGTKRYYYNISGSTNGTFSGISIYQNGLIFQIEIIDSGGNYAGAQITQQMYLGDLFKPQLMILEYNGSSLRCYFRRNLGVGSVVARTFAPSVTAARVGRAGSSATEPMPTFGWLGMMGSDAHTLTALEAAQIYDAFRLNGRLTAYAGKTQKLWDVPQDIIDAGGAAPTTVLERMGTGDHFVAVNGAGSMIADAVSEDGVVAPYVMPDSITATTTDRMDILGDHRVIVYDPTSYDSRSTLYGVKDFNNGGVHLGTAINKGIRGAATGFWLHWYGRWDRLASGLAILAATTVNGGNGWQLYQNASNGILYFNVYGSTNVAVTSANGVLTAADLAKPQQIQAVYDGAMLYLYFKRVLIGSAACTGYATPGNVAMYFGGRGDNIIPAFGITGLALQGGDGYAPTVAELQACYDATEATGKLQPIPGSTAAGVLRTQHAWDFDKDVRANGPANGLPAQYLDRIGVDHMTAGAAGLSIATQDKPSQGKVQSGIQNFSDVNGYDAAAGQGLLGHASTFHFVWRGMFLRVPTVGQVLMNCLSAAQTAGCHLQVTTVAAVRFGTSSAALSSTFTVTAAMLFQPMVIHAVFRNGTVQLFLDGVQQGADVTGAGLTVNTGGVFSVGRLASSVPASQGATDVVCFQCGGGEYAPTVDEIALQVINAQRDNRLTGLGATKTTHLYDFDKDVAENGGVEMGAPAVSLDRVGTAHLARSQFEAVSALNGIRAVGPFAQGGDGYLAAVGDGPLGNASAWFAMIDIRVLRMPGSLENVMGAITNPGGWIVQLIGTSGTTFSIRGCIQNVSYLGQLAINASDFGKRIRILVQRTNANLMQTFVCVQGGTVQSVDNGFAGHNVPTGVGFWLGNTAPSTANGFTSGVIEFAQASQNQALTPAEITAQFADMTTRPPSVSGKTYWYWTAETAIRDNAGKLPSVLPNTGTPGVGTLQRSGHSLVTTSRSERMWSYDDKPIIYGAKGDYSNVFSSASAAPGDPTGFMVEIFFTILTMNVSSANRYIVGRRGSSDGTNGWTIQAAGTHTVWNFYAGNASTQAGSPAAMFTSADVGKLLVFTGVYDGPNQLVRGYTKRARLGTGTGLASYGVPTGAFNLGGTANSPSQSIGPFVAIHGFRYGAFVPTANEVLAAYDHMLANEKMLPAGYPGRQFINHYTFATSVPPATLKDAMNNADLTHTGTPVANDVYHRQWAA